MANNVTARLDVAMLPAFVSASSVGLYSVATNVSLIVYQLSNTFAGLVLPAAAADPERGPPKVIGSLWALAGDRGRRGARRSACSPSRCWDSCYGDRFEDAAEPLILLLPGAVLFAGSLILSAGVFAAGRPFTATMAQVLGMVVTVIGLLVFLALRRRHGGRAGIHRLLRHHLRRHADRVQGRSPGLSWAAFLPTPARVRALAS